MHSTLQRKLFITGLAASVLFSACSSKDKKVEKTGGAAGGKAGAPPPSRVDVYIVKTSALSDNLELPGSLIANESTPVNPEISGRLTYLNATEGRTVGKGTLIAKIYDGDLRAQLNKLQVQAKVQQQTARRYEELLKIQGVSQQEYDLAKLEISNVLADMAIVRSNIMRTEIRAPFSGTLGLKMISPGAYVTPATVITTIRQTSQLKLDYTLPERYSNKVKIGQLISFTTEGSSKVYNAKILATESGVSEENRSLIVRATVTNNDGNLIPGQFVKVSTNFDPDPNAIMIPSQAVIPQARGKQVAVYTNGIADFRNIETGARDSANVQVITGLKVGDTIITTGLMSLKPKGKVTLGKVVGGAQR
ncbi:MAG: efflux RND transporter periplasmic adaptor subunit [Chitinophagaceae bacterium]|nr:MAG: efflux RND transporter periplasmic adaptor subunit [Chitinophagaceae bacterium]